MKTARYKRVSRPRRITLWSRIWSGIKDFTKRVQPVILFSCLWFQVIFWGFTLLDSEYVRARSLPENPREEFYIRARLTKPEEFTREELIDNCKRHGYEGYDFKEERCVGEPKVEIRAIAAYEVIAEGKVSYYSKAGCLGCHPDQIMANGEPFDENDFTLAIPAEWRKGIALNTKKCPDCGFVRVTNLDNGKRAVARITDTGGFLKYNRIADLSKALYEELGAKTDQSTIRIEGLPVLDSVE